MTDQQILNVLNLYEATISLLRGYYTKEAEAPRPSWSPELEHCLSMIPTMRTFLQEGRRDKCNRWLGFLQGILYCEGVFSIDEMKEHNRTPQEAGASSSEPSSSSSSSEGNLPPSS